MDAYILRRLLLMIPTIIGIMAISFAVVQFAPAGPWNRSSRTGTRPLLAATGPEGRLFRRRGCLSRADAAGPAPTCR